jgi:hypothetical protein
MSCGQKMMGGGLKEDLAAAKEVLAAKTADFNKVSATCGAVRGGCTSAKAPMLAAQKKVDDINRAILNENTARNQKKANEMANAQSKAKEAALAAGLNNNAAMASGAAARAAVEAKWAAMASGAAMGGRRKGGRKSRKSRKASKSRKSRKSKSRKH